MIAQARLRYLRGSPQKARLVVNQIRGKDVGPALAVLRHSPKAVARDVEKLLRASSQRQRLFAQDADRILSPGDPTFHHHFSVVSSGLLPGGAQACPILDPGHTDTRAFVYGFHHRRKANLFRRR